MRVKVSPHLVMVTEDYKVFSESGRKPTWKGARKYGRTESGDNLFKMFSYKGERMG